jgi:hypothetical protein
VDIEIDDIAKIGSVVDTPSYMLPPEAWTQALNMRVVDGGMESLLGWSQVFGTPLAAPHFSMPISTSAAFFWMYASLNKIMVFDGTTHSDITRAGGPYTANDTPDWNGTLLGGVPIFNNNNDVPQYWNKIDPSVKMADLLNWPTALRAKIMRAFGPYLMAFNLTDGGTNLPHTVQWSHPADPGSLPISWNYADPTVDAGRNDFSDVNSGTIEEAQALGSVMLVYKESSTWKVRFIGGRFVFDFGQTAWITTSGILAPRCVGVTGDGTRHIVATQDDIIWHDGNNYKSALDKRQRRRLFNEIDTDNYGTSFMFDNPYRGEMWFCYPSSGNQYPNKALILYYRDADPFAITEADGITFRNAASGGIEKASDEQWDAGTDTWDTDTGPWSQLQRRRVILSAPALSKHYLLDDTITRDGVNFPTTLTREGLSLLGRKRNGDWIVDHEIHKLVDGLWPKVQGGPVSIRMGAQQIVNGPTLWGSPVIFDPTATSVGYPDVVSGRAVGLEFSTAGGVTWRLDGYKYNVIPMGKF